MSDPWILITGFGAFESFERNPSAEVATRLAEAPPLGYCVRSTILPVSFERAPLGVDRFLGDQRTALGDARLLLGLGVHSRGGFRVEVAARGKLDRTDRPDVDGRVANDSGASERSDAWVRTTLEGEIERSILGRTGWRISEAAGGYVCERVFRHLLDRGSELGIPSLFVHVPRAEEVAPAAQALEVRRFLETLLG